MRPSIRLLILAWTLVTFYFTLTPADYLPESRLWGYDKIGHLGIFGGWTFLFGVFTRSQAGRTWLAGAVFSSLVEFLQYALPINRTAEWGDVAANLTGVTLVTCIIMLLRRTGWMDYLDRE